MAEIIAQLPTRRPLWFLAEFLQIQLRLRILGERIRLLHRDAMHALLARVADLDGAGWARY
jgi:hypothetical protein